MSMPVKVWTTAGVESWVLTHVEVQTDRDPDFPLRMYVYNYRIFDRYNKPVASLAVLADEGELAPGSVSPGVVRM